MHKSQNSASLFESCRTVNSILANCDVVIKYDNSFAMSLSLNPCRSFDKTIDEDVLIVVLKHKLKAKTLIRPRYFNVLKKIRGAPSLWAWQMAHLCCYVWKLVGFRADRSWLVRVPELSNTHPCEEIRCVKKLAIQILLRILEIR